MSDDDSATAHAIRAIKAEGFAAGYDRAIANLLDRAMFSEWFASVGRNPDVDLPEGARLSAVAYLESLKENDV